ncbi:MAG: ribonuclease E/G [Paracoccaceae bacterium]
MKGRIAVLERFGERGAAALMVDGRLQDLWIDPAGGGALLPGAIHRAIAERPLKGQGGLFVRLAGGARGFLRQGKGLSPGQPLLVQIAATAESGKAPPVTVRLMFKGRFAILTPGAAGRNISRAIKSEAERDRLAEIAHDALSGAPDDLGAILRSAADGCDGDAITDEINALLNTCNAVLGDGQGAEPELLLDAPGAQERAWRDWTCPAPEQVFSESGSFTAHAVWDEIDALRRPDVVLGAQAFMFIEPTRALIAIDVNTGGDFSPSAGLKANLAAVRELPRQLRLRGLGGQIVIDCAPMPKKDRRTLEATLRRALRDARDEMSVVGWTPLGHLELQRKCARLPLRELLHGLPNNR